MREIRTEIEIAAAPERVWEILTNFSSFPEWNPYIRSASGEIGRGERLEVYLQPSEGCGMTFRPTVLNVDPGCEFRWLGHLLIPGVFDGEHVFEIEPAADSGVRFVQRETFRGLLAPLLLRLLENDTRRGFQEMNQALKTRVEQNAPILTSTPTSLLPTDHFFVSGQRIGFCATM